MLPNVAQFAAMRLYQTLIVFSGLEVQRKSQCPKIRKVRAKGHFESPSFWQGRASARLGHSHSIHWRRSNPLAPPRKIDERGKGGISRCRGVQSASRISDTSHLQISRAILLVIFPVSFDYFWLTTLISRDVAEVQVRRASMHQASSLSGDAPKGGQICGQV